MGRLSSSLDALRGCTTTRELQKLHQELLLDDLLSTSTLLANALLEMYAKCGSPDEARSVFDSIHHPNLFSWNLMLSAYAQNGMPWQCSRLFSDMPKRDVVSWNACLKAFARSGHSSECRQFLHRMPQLNIVSCTSVINASLTLQDARLVYFGLIPRPERDVYCDTAMLTAFAKHGHLEEAWDLFNAMPAKNPVSWNALLSGYAAQGLDVLNHIFDKMPAWNPISWNIKFHAYAHCGHSLQLADERRIPPAVLIGAASGGVEAKLAFDRSMERDAAAWNALVKALAAEEEQLGMAELAFDKMPQQGIVAGTSLLAAYARRGDAAAARRLFHSMPTTNSSAWNALLAAESGDAGVFERMPAHGQASWAGLMSGDAAAALAVFKAIPERRVALWNVLISALCNAGFLEQARMAIERMPQLSCVPCNAMLAAYALVPWSSADACSLFHRMRHRSTGSWTCIISAAAEDAEEAFSRMPAHDEVALSAAVHSCSRAGNLGGCRRLLEQNAHCESAWVTMLSCYASHGLMDEAQATFDRIRSSSSSSTSTKEIAIAWHAMLSAHCSSGDEAAAVDLLRLMELEGSIAVDAVALLSVLAACNHQGKIDHARRLFATYANAIDLMDEHHRCIAHIHARAGTSLNLNRWIYEYADPTAVRSCPFLQ